MTQKYTGYGVFNALLDELEELKELAQLRANDLKASGTSRAKAQASAEAYGGIQVRILYHYSNIESPA